MKEQHKEANTIWKSLHFIEEFVSCRIIGKEELKVTCFSLRLYNILLWCGLLFHKDFVGF